MKHLPIRLTSMLCAVVLMGVCAGSAHGFDWGKVKQGAEQAYRGTSGGLSNDEVVRGLKQALEIGAKNAAGSASKLNGFYKNPLIFIPFPAEAKKVKDIVETIGMKKQVDDFVMTLNRAAEEAAKQAAPIFLNAITAITIADGFKILKGADNAATQYLQGRTLAPLKSKFKPVVKNAIDKVQVTRYWNPIVTAYNGMPMAGQKVNPDLEAYVTDRALTGLFKLIAKEEKNIRKNPAARVTDLLRRVFGA
jgi:hypothetical protein